MVILWPIHSFLERVMGLEPTISCLGSKRSTTELHPHRKKGFHWVYSHNSSASISQPRLDVPAILSFSK